MLSKNPSLQLRRAIEIINDTNASTHDPRIMLVRALLENARCAAIFARRLREALAHAGEDQVAPDEALRGGLAFIAAMTAQEFMSLNGLSTADRKGVLDEALVWAMNAWRRAAISDASWYNASTRCGIAVSGAVVCEALPADVLEAVGAKTIAVRSLVSKPKSSRGPAGGGVWEEGYTAGALLYQYQPLRQPCAHIEPASVAMLLQFLPHSERACRYLASGLALRTADMVLLCCRVPAVDDSGGDPHVAVEALTPLRRIVNHMHVPLKELLEQRATQPASLGRPTDAGQPKSARTSNAKMVISGYALEPGCFSDDATTEGRDRVQALEDLLNATGGPLVVVNAEEAAFANVVVIGRAKLVLLHNRHAADDGVLTMATVLEAFANVMPLAVGCSDAQLCEGAISPRVPRHKAGRAVPAAAPDESMAPDTAAGQQALTEQLIGIGSGRGDLSRWACAAVRVDSDADLTAAADFVVDSVLVHEASKKGGIHRAVVTATAAFDPADPTRLVGTFRYPLLRDGAWQQTIVYTPPRGSGKEKKRPLRVTYRYFVLSTTTSGSGNTAVGAPPYLFYPLA